MRYTTIVDISENSGLYRNKNVRLVYLHLCLRSGYHNEDRDLIDISIRNLAWAVGISVASTRHALKMLEASRMIKRYNGLWHVRKFILEQEITPRDKTQKDAKKTQQAQAERATREANEATIDSERARREQLEAAHTSDFIIYYESQLELARQGDIHAQRVVKQRHELYIEDCRKRGHEPIQI